MQVLFRAVDLDPDPGEYICQLKLKKYKKIANNCNFITFFNSKFSQGPFVLNFEQGFMFL